jgi:hypothetical protein
MGYRRNNQNACGFFLDVSIFHRMRTISDTTPALAGTHICGREFSRIDTNRIKLFGLDDWDH